MISGGNYWRDNTSYTSDLDPSDTLIGLFDQFNNQRSTSLYQDYVFGYHRTGDAKSTTFSSEFRVTESGNRGTADLFGTIQQGNASTGVFAIPNEHDVTTGGNPVLSLQTDYTKPFGEKTKLESGFKEILRRTTNDFSAAYLDSTTGVYDVVPSRSVDVNYREQIGSAYVVLSQQIGKVQTQAGLRLEDAMTTLFLPTTQQRVDNTYASAFPSGVLSYAFTATRQLKLSYSRRISRPNAYQLDPVVMKQDSRDYFVGNPELAPQYTDAVELAYQETTPWGSIQVNPYLRNTAHAVRYIQTVDSTGITTSTYENVASTVQDGVDVNVTYHGGPLTIFTGGNAYHYSSNASNLPGNLSTEAFVWSARLNATWKLTSTLDVQDFANDRLEVRDLSDIGHMSGRVSNRELREPAEAGRRSWKHHAARAGSVQHDDVRVDHAECGDCAVEFAELWAARGVHLVLAHVRTGSETPAADDAGSAADVAAAAELGLPRTIA